MADIKFNVLQKPYEERLLDAACIYWEVTENFFKIKNKDGDTEKRQVLFYLMKTEANMELGKIATMFDRQKPSIFEACENIDTRKNINLTIAHAIRDIKQIATNLDANIVVANIKLENKT